MRKAKQQQIILFLGMAVLLLACQKDDINVPPPIDPGSEIPTRPIRLQAVVSIGQLIYDSVPAQFTIMSWDKQNQAHIKDTVIAGKGIVHLPASHQRFQIKVSKWGITDEMTIEQTAIDPNTTYVLGGAKTAKKLMMEESFLLVQGQYQPSSKAIYSYGTKGLQHVTYFQKKPQFANLQLTMRHEYQYSGNNVVRINRIDSAEKLFGYTEFTYNPQGTKVTNIHEVSPAGETGAAISHEAGGIVSFDYLFSNGHSMQYEMQFKGGNKVYDIARSSRGGSESGNYKYDTNINPYAHMNMPDLFLSNLSKNNTVSQQKGYSGAYPVAEPYQFDYTYDSDGYPISLVKHYKNHFTGEFMYQTKTVFSY